MAQTGSTLCPTCVQLRKILPIPLDGALDERFRTLDLEVFNPWHGSCVGRMSHIEVIYMSKVFPG